jgi:aminoglycoside 3-N-acetyltransferase
LRNLSIADLLNKSKKRLTFSGYWTGQSSGNFLGVQMLTYRNLIKALRELGLVSESKVLIHASVPALVGVSGGAETLTGALLATADVVMTPTFTTKSMIVPPFGPEENAIQYAASQEDETIVEPFHMELPADPSLGELAEIIRLHPEAQRSTHPLLSFAGVNAADLLSTQSLADPWAPVKQLADADGDVLLVGADHTTNISIHYAELLAGRRQFLRWAIWDGKIVEVPHWPGCRKGFQSIASKLEGVVREEAMDGVTLQAIPLRDLINIAKGWIQEDPEALLCQDADCEYCMIIRTSQEASR